MVLKLSPRRQKFTNGAISLIDSGVCLGARPGSLKIIGCGLFQAKRDPSPGSY
jgi:hypothetical protein